MFRNFSTFPSFLWLICTHYRRSPNTKIGFAFCSSLLNWASPLHMHVCSASFCLQMYMDLEDLQGKVRSPNLLQQSEAISYIASLSSSLRSLDVRCEDVFVYPVEDASSNCICNYRRLYSVHVLQHVHDDCIYWCWALPSECIHQKLLQMNQSDFGLSSHSCSL